MSVAVLQYHQYSGGRDSQSVYSTRYFCASCRRDIGQCFEFPAYPEDLEAKNESEHGFIADRPDRDLEHYAFCPWCGVAFAEEWWKDRTIQNERVIDHYRKPGMHRGDRHTFRADMPEDYVAYHWLAVSGGSEVCWCDPEVEPGIMRCVVRHQNKRYEDVMALRREMQPPDDEDDDY